LAIQYMLEHMKQVLLELDDRTAARLEEVAPARSRRRSEFLRMAIQKALWEVEERTTAEAYARQPDSADPAYFEASVWEPQPASLRKSRPKR